MLPFLFLSNKSYFDGESALILILTSGVVVVWCDYYPQCRLSFSVDYLIALH